MEEEKITQMQQNIDYLCQNIEHINNEWSIEEVQVKPVSVFKRLMRKLTYWLYRPMWDQQREFNKYIAAAMGDMFRNQSIIVDELSEGGVFTSASYTLESNGKPRVIQLVSSLNFGDAVGNEVIAFKKALQENGFVTEIFAETIHKKIAPNTAMNFKKLPELNENDIVIYHFSSQCGMFETVKKLKCKVILRYHNITPPAFFHGYDANAEKATATGLKQVKELKDYVDYCLPVSEFNKHDLIEMGYTCPMTVIPILIQFSDYELAPSQAVIDKYTDGRTNCLFVGRMAPNKKVEDVISCFAEYKKNYDKTARLFLVGSFNENDKYYQMLCKHIKKLGVEDVIFPGHIPFNEILAYYSIADVFICMSEHEGFCVPLVEAMYFHAPIVAFSSSAIPSTLNGSGVLLESKNDMKTCAEAVYKVTSDKEYAARIVDGQNKRLLDFDREKILSMIIREIKKFVEE